MATSELPDAEDAELYANVIAPLASGQYYEAFVAIRDTPESELYLSYTRMNEIGEPEANLELAQDMLTDTQIALTEARRSLRYTEEDDDDE